MWSPAGLFLVIMTVPQITVSSPQATGMDRIRSGEFFGQAYFSSSFKLMDWNIDRGLHLRGIIDALLREKPDVILLQEVDLNARRTGRRNVAEELAREFRLNYVFGVEFHELGQGSRSSPAYHGQAILARCPIRSPRVLRFENQTDFWAPRWYLPKQPMFQRRLGGRIALVAELEADRTLVVYNLHLESRGSETLRLRQLEGLLADVRRYPTATPIIVAGDFNTELGSSPLIRLLKEAGFRNAISKERTATGLRGRTLDWLFVRGALSFDDGRVLQDVKASDHYPLCVRLRLSNTGHTPDSSQPRQLAPGGLCF